MTLPAVGLLMPRDPVHGFGINNRVCSATVSVSVVASVVVVSGCPAAETPPGGCRGPPSEQAA